MEKVNARRSFIKGFGLLGAVIAGAATVDSAHAASQVVGNIPDRDVDSVHRPAAARDEDRPPVNASLVSITGSYGEPHKIEVNDGYYIVQSNFTPTHRVDMAVGHDNRLWIKVDDQWKRVAVE